MTTALVGTIRAATMVAALLTIHAGLHAQISVNPTRVLLAAGQRSCEVTVQNTTDQPVDVTASFGFKLIRSDSLGVIWLDSMAQTPEESSKSCRNWLRVFPRRFTLGAGATQTMRIVGSAPVDAVDGEYWGRLVLTPIPLDRPTNSVDTSSSIESRMTMIVALDLPVIFRKGRPETGIVIDSLSLRRDTAGMELLVDTRRLGNSAYRGTVVAVLRTSTGMEIARAEEQFTTEFTRRQALHFPAIDNGAYRLELSVTSVRTGGAEEVVVPALPLAREYELRLGGAGAPTIASRN